MYVCCMESRINPQLVLRHSVLHTPGFRSHIYLRILCLWAWRKKIDQGFFFWTHTSPGFLFNTLPGFQWGNTAGSTWECHFRDGSLSFFPFRTVRRGRFFFPSGFRNKSQSASIVFCLSSSIFLLFSIFIIQQLFRMLPWKWRWTSGHLALFVHTYEL